MRRMPSHGQQQQRIAHLAWFLELSVIHFCHYSFCQFMNLLDDCLQVPQFAEYGRLFKSSEPVQLTEEETEYNIVVIKHVFPNHTVLQFQCTNTVQEQVLEDVSVSVDLSDAVIHRDPYQTVITHTTV